jgi:uncharacterized membrane protein YraQ (UPF0718 family)
MAEENLKDFTINWMITGLLFTVLIGFSISFMLNNSDIGVGDPTYSILNKTYANYTSKLELSSDGANKLLNITSKTNPEVSELGSRDSVSSAYEAKTVGTKYWDTSKQLISWIFSGDIGKMLLSTLAGIIAFLSFYYIYVFIRRGG